MNDDALRPASQQTLAAMLQSIVHRGPDDQGSLVDGPLAMGMRRLSIIDLETGRQPISDEQGRYELVFNGEIYNYIELRDELRQRGHVFRTNSDTEVVVHLYEEMGEKCLQHLRGMFAFAIWDRQQRELFIARDRLGIKPLYYSHSHGCLLFGSEIKAILRHPSMSAEVDAHALSEFLSMRYVPAPRTLFAGIHSLPPGCWLKTNGGSLQIESYWDLSYAGDEGAKNEDEYADELGELLRESVHLRLRSDAPFGAFLSGGLDSSTIVALMSQELAAPVKTFSVGFDGGAEADELPYARQVAKQLGCDHHEIVVTASDFIEQAETVAYHLDQPIADQATMATLLLSKLASSQVKMVLSGEGGDELFAGYARYAAERWSPYLRHMPRWVGSALRAGLPRLPGLRRPKIAARALSLPDEATRFANWFPLFNDDMKRQLLDEVDPQREASQVYAERLQRCNAKDSVHRLMYADTKMWLPDYLLLRGDKLTMAHSLEARTPLLDHKLVEFAARLPLKMKLNKGVRKYLLKRVAGQLLPEEIVHRRKQGFPIPIASWMRNEAREMVDDLLGESALARRGIYQAEYVKQLVDQHQRGFADHAVSLWGLMSVELWMRSYLDNSSVPATPVPVAGAG